MPSAIPTFDSSALARSTPFISSVEVWSLLQFLKQLLCSHFLELMPPLQHHQSWRTLTLSLMCHTQTQSSRELSGHTRKSKVPQNLEIITKALEQMWLLQELIIWVLISAYESIFQITVPKQKRLTIKTYTEVINQTTAKP